jgi:hypothetical protein
MQALAGPLISQVPFTPFNLVCTNVPGPQYPLYLLGHKMLRWYPYVPVGGEMALNCAILSYDGTAHFGFSGDVHAAPDLRRLEEFLKASFAELRDAGIKPPRRKSLPRKRAVVKPRATANPESEPAAEVRLTIPLNVPLASRKPADATAPITEDGKVSTQMIA